MKGRSSPRARPVVASDVDVSPESLTAFFNRETGVDAVWSVGGPDAVARALGCDESTGLSSEMVRKRRETHGANVFVEHQSKSFFSHLLEAFNDSTLLVLVGAAAFSMFNGLVLSDDRADLIEGLAILTAMVVVAGVTSTLNYFKDLEFRALNKFKSDFPVRVVRNGERQVREARVALLVCLRYSLHVAWQSISVLELVVGDLLELDAGSNVPVDALLLSGHGVVCNEANQTGESNAVPKSIDSGSDCALLSGTIMEEGSGRCVVTAVGAYSNLGKLVALMEESEPPPTKLQELLDGLAGTIGWFGFVAAVLTSAVLTVIALMPKPEAALTWAFWSGSFVQFVIVGVTIVVVAVPEGLPLAVTISLAFSSRAMIADKNFVRKLEACETMGTATVICSDKTGTLTENRMRVVAGSIAGRDFDSLASTTTLSLPEPVADAVADALAQNSTAERGVRDGRPVWMGNQTECALLAFCDDALKRPIPGIRIRQSSHHGSVGVVFRDNFSSETKTMTTVVRTETVEGRGGSEQCWLYVKGAPEIVIDRCRLQLASGGGRTATSSAAAASAAAAGAASSIVATAGTGSELLSEAARSAMMDRVKRLGLRGLRTIAVARRLVTTRAGSLTEDGWKDMASKDLELVAVFGIQDPLRAGVSEAVATCQKAGVRVVMVTGDIMPTAQSIAKECGILDAHYDMDDSSRDPYACMTGPEFRKLSEAERDEVARRIQVLARSSPTDKHLMVESQIRNGEIVAVTGDGTNDAPALRKAHVGLAMGISGTDTAKEASEIVILDDNFRSIVAAVKWGRSIMENVRKFLVFQLTINIVALIVTFAVACTLGSASSSGHPDELQDRLARQLPLNPPQLLWLNLVMDSLAALALATEPPSEDLLDRKPERGMTLISPTMWKHILGHALVQLVVLITLYLHPQAHQWLSVEEFRSAEHRTVIFNTFVLLQLFNMANARKIRDEFNILANIHRSTLTVVIFAAIVAAQVIIVQYGSAIFGTVALNTEQWTRCILIGSMSLPIGVILRLLPCGRPSATSAVAVKDD